MSSPTPDRLEKLLDHLRIDNPFLTDRVTAPSRTDVDVGDIHRGPFQKLTDLARQARDHNQGIGAVLWGEAGVGKSHLLSRLWRWADQHQAPFVFLHNLQADADRLPRYVLKALLSALTYGRVHHFHDTPLYRLVKAVIEEALRLDGPAHIRSRDRIERAYGHLIDHLAEASALQQKVLDRTVCQVLLHFYLSANQAHHHGTDNGLARLAADWLGGDHLEVEEARRLGIRPERSIGETVTLTDDEHIKQVLFALAQLALYRGQPFLLCFDGVDNLPAEKIEPLTRFLHALLDSSGNLLVIFSGVYQTLQKYRKDGVISESTWDRLAREEIVLSRITRSQGQEILTARLDRSLEPFRDLDPVQRIRCTDPLFPLGRTWFEQRVGRMPELRPRDVINWARERWAEQQRLLDTMPGANWLTRWSGAEPPPSPPPPPPLEELIDRGVDEKMAEHRALVKDRPHTLPPSADNLAGLVRTLLEQCLGHDPALVRIDKPRPPRPNQKPACDLVVRQRSPYTRPETTSGLAFLATSNATSTTGALRKLVQETQTLDRLLLVTEERLPLKLGAQKDAQGRKYLESLKGLGPERFRHVELTFDQYADLNALQAAVGLARSGDLEVELPGGQFRPVSEPEVIASHHRRSRYTAQPLLRQVLQPSSQPDVPATVGSAGASTLKTVREFIMAQLALTMGASSHELALRLPDHLKATEPRTPEDCEVLVRQAAQQLHEEGRLHATSLGDSLFLLPKTR